MAMLCGLLADPPPPPQPTLNTTIVRSEETNRQLRDREKKTEAMNGSSPDQVTWIPWGEKSHDLQYMKTPGRGGQGLLKTKRYDAKSKDFGGSNFKNRRAKACGRN
jgi:hypothetical protein